MSNELISLRNRISELKLKKAEKLSVRIEPGLSPIMISLLAELLTKNGTKKHDD